LIQSLDSPRNNSVAQTAAERLTTTSGSDFSSACMHSNTWTWINILNEATNTEDFYL